MMSEEVIDCKKSLSVGGKDFDIWSLRDLQEQGHAIKKMPFSIRILLENALRNHDGLGVTSEHVDTLLQWKPNPEKKEVPYKPARVLMQDFTGVPAVVDLASVRAEAAKHGVEGSKVNPLIPVDLVIDHSVQVDFYGDKDSLDKKDSVLIIDDLIATGGTAEAAAKLVEISEAKVAAFVFVINLFDLGGSDNLIKDNYKVENLIDFPGH